MLDVYAHWRSALAGTPDHTVRLPTGTGADDSPQPGLYKVAATRGGPKVPLTIMVTVAETGAVLHAIPAYDAERHALAATLNGEAIDNPAHYFPYAVAVSKADLAHYSANRRWPGELAEVGHNSGAVDLSLFEQLAEAIELADGYIAKTRVTDQMTADMAANHAAKVRQIKGALDKERDAKVRPHIDAQRTINAEYKPAIESADAAVARINVPVTAFLKAERDKREAEAKRKAEEENARRLAAYEAERKAAEAERARIVAEQETAAAPTHYAMGDAIGDVFGDQAPLATVALPDMPAPPVMTIAAPVKMLAGGQRGKRTGLKTVTSYVCDDYAATLAHVASHPDVQEAVLKVARQQMRAGATVPGMRIATDEVAA